jgi:hypothetical protein
MVILVGSMRSGPLLRVGREEDGVECPPRKYPSQQTEREGVVMWRLPTTRVSKKHINSTQYHTQENQCITWSSSACKLQLQHQYHRHAKVVAIT